MARSSTHTQTHKFGEVNSLLDHFQSVSFTPVVPLRCWTESAWGDDIPVSHWTAFPQSYLWSRPRMGHLPHFLWRETDGEVVRGQLKVGDSDTWTTADPESPWVKFSSPPPSVVPAAKLWPRAGLHVFTWDPHTRTTMLWATLAATRHHDNDWVYAGFVADRVCAVDLDGDVAHVDPLVSRVKETGDLFIRMSVQLLQGAADTWFLKTMSLGEPPPPDPLAATSVVRQCCRYLGLLVDVVSDDPRAFKHVFSWSRGLTHLYLAHCWGDNVWTVVSTAPRLCWGFVWRLESRLSEVFTPPTGQELFR